MTLSDAYCDFCDLPLATCVHGQPPPPPPPPAATSVVRTAPKARSTTPRQRAAAPPEKQLNRRWTAPEALEPLILDVLRQAGGELDTDDFFLELEIAADDLLLPGDHERTPSGELRWHYAARRARLAMVEQGVMIKGRPGVWALAGTAHQQG